MHIAAISRPPVRGCGRLRRTARRRALPSSVRTHLPGDVKPSPVQARRNCYGGCIQSMIRGLFGISTLFPRIAEASQLFHKFES
jgi:hypothetical protein